MRVRKKKHGAERILACSHYLIESPSQLTADPGAVFPVKQPVCLEIGCGKGTFAVGMAAKYPQYNWIAMEKVPDVAVTALERAAATADSRPDNLRFLIGDAQFLTDYLPPHSLDTLYINFCDPWPKKGHAKRRLTYHTFLDRYRTLLREDGQLIFKTDNEGLFDFSLEEFAAAGLPVLWSTRDLHHSDTVYAAENVMTEYETHFSAQGMPIYAAHVAFPAVRPQETEESV